MLFTLKKGISIAIGLCVLTTIVFSFQNCGKTQFSAVPSISSNSTVVPSSPTTPTSPVCNLSDRLSDFENIQCLAPRTSLLFGRQFYNVICNESGQWLRVARGPADYSQCPNTCLGSSPSDVENVFCPAPNNVIKNGLQHFTVTCLKEGVWSRTVNGAADYNACPAVCDPNNIPSLTSAVACPAPNTNLMSGLQNYTVSCQADGNWGRILTGGVDYSRCPQACDQTKKPSLIENEKCPATADIFAVRSYSVICNTNGTWSKTPTTLDTSRCPAPTCDLSKKPSVQDTVACPVPFQSSLLSKQNFTVSCSGTNWVRTPTTRDDLQCPKSCGVQPLNDFNLIACQSPFQSTVQAKQGYNYVCNTVTGQYSRNAWGAIDYNSCPRSCVGLNPAVRKVISCPVGFSGTAYQNYSSTCNTVTGLWTTPQATVIDNSGCSPLVCSGQPPTNFDPAACPAPFQSRLDAKKMYSAARCVSGAWVRGTLTGVIDSSSCPVNDCSGSVNPGTEKDIMACSGGATGRVYQTCSLSCTGNTYSQINCSANNYSRCDCGANATFSLVTRSCVQNYTYKWDLLAVSRGSCSATSCGTSGAQAGTYTTCRRNDGVIVSSNLCGSSVAPSISCSMSACPLTCSSGSLILGGSCQTCNVSNASAWYLVANPDVKAAGMDALIHWCNYGKNEGRSGCFQTSQCAPKTCAGGSIDVQSVANNMNTKTTCSFSWNTAQVGQMAVVTRATNGGTISGLCSASGDWVNVNTSCPQPADVGCTNGATNYPSCNNRSCNAGKSVGTLKCAKICKGIDIGIRYIPGYLINAVSNGQITNQANITTGSWGTHFHPTVNHYAFACNDGQLNWSGPDGWCEYHVDQLGVDAECDTAINNPYVSPCSDGNCGGG